MEVKIQSIYSLWKWFPKFRWSQYEVSVLCHKKQMFIFFCAFIHLSRGQVKVLETHHQRFKSDLHTCVSFIQEPKKLKDSVKMIYAKYVTEVDVVSGSYSEEDMETSCHQQSLSKGILLLGPVAQYHAEAWLSPFPSSPLPSPTLLQSNCTWACLSYLIYGVQPVFLHAFFHL